MAEILIGIDVGVINGFARSRGNEAMRENAPPVIRCNWESYRRSVGGEHA